MKQFGMGCYQQRGYCADLYDSCGGNPKNVPKPSFYGKSESQPGEE